MNPKGIKLSFSTNAFTSFSVEEAVEKIASLGYEGVEILADLPHAFPPEMSTGDLKRLRAVVEKTGILVANVNANTACGYYGRTFWDPVFEPSMANPDPEARAWRVRYTRQCIDLARELGSRSVSVTSGRMVPGIMPQDSMKLLRSSLSEVLEYAEEKGVNIGVEYEPGLLVEHCDELVGLLDGLGSSRLGANLDVGHSFVQGEDVPRVIRILSESIFHVHLEDIKGRKHYHLPPGQGDMDFGAVFETLRAVGYQGLVTVELYTLSDRPHDAAREARVFLEEFLRG